MHLWAFAVKALASGMLLLLIRSKTCLGPQDAQMAVLQPHITWQRALAWPQCIMSKQPSMYTRTRRCFTWQGVRMAVMLCQSSHTHAHEVSDLDGMH